MSRLQNDRTLRGGAGFGGSAQTTSDCGLHDKVSTEMESGLRTLLARERRYELPSDPRAMLPMPWLNTHAAPDDERALAPISCEGSLFGVVWYFSNGGVAGLFYASDWRGRPSLDALPADPDLRFFILSVFARYEVDGLLRRLSA